MKNRPGKRVRIVDSTLRDGSHSISHQYTPDQVREITRGLDAAGVEIIEISHGDGLGGSSIQYGFDRTPDEEKLRIAASVVTNSKIAVLLLPGMGKKKGMEVLCFLMMAHMAPVETLVEQALLMQGYGADGVYVVDSAGALLPGEVRQRVEALVDSLDIQVGFHAHNNLGLAVGNSLAALEEGAALLDGSLRGMGAGAGNAMTEALVAVLQKAGYETGIDL